MRTIIIKKPLAISIVAAALIGHAVSARGETHHYTIDVDEELSRLHVAATFGATVSRVGARSSSAAQFLTEARDCGRDRPIDATERRMHLPRGGITCLSYTVDLHQAALAERRNRSLDDANIVVSPTVWMWRPLLGAGDEILVHFVLPPNTNVSVPWLATTADAAVFSLRASPQSGAALAVFGNFESAETTVAGTTLRVALLSSGSEYDAAAVVDWIRETAQNVSLAYGRFPNPAVHVVVVPVDHNPWGGDAPVHFGRVIRDGGESVELLIDPGKPVESYHDNWTATHEFSHMMLPFVDRRHRWISEGFAQYYQNVLLARAGRYSERDAWQKIYEGLERGRQSVPSLSPNQASAEHGYRNRMKIYWSGAALALMADVELRRRSNGSESLDSVLDKLQRCCLPSKRSWSGTELFAKLDSFIGEPLFMNLYRQYADAEGFPDARPLLERLGVAGAGDRTRLLDDAELAEIRAAISARRYTDASGGKRHSKHGE